MTQLSKLTTLFFIQFLGNIYLDNQKITQEFMSKSFFNQYFLHINLFFITILHTTQGFFLLSALLRDCLNLPIGYYQVVRLPLAMLWAQRSDSLPWHSSSVRCRIIFNFFIACIEQIEIKTQLYDMIVTQSKYVPRGKGKCRPFSSTLWNARGPSNKKIAEPIMKAAEQLSFMVK